jgi:hypothetical protein
MELLKTLHEIVIHAKFGKEREKEQLDKKVAANVANKFGATFVKPGDERLAGAKKITMMQAFGSREMNILNDAGIKLTEKPYWEDFEEGGYYEDRNIHDIKLKKVERELGHKLPVFTGKDVFGVDQKPNGALATVKGGDTSKFPNMFIIEFSDGTRYLVDSTQASTYIRMWQKIVSA